MKPTRTSLFKHEHDGSTRAQRGESEPSRQYFDSAEYFMMLHQEVQKNSEQNLQKYVDQMSFHVEQFIEKYGENKETKKINQILHRKGGKPATRFDSADYFTNLEKQTQDLSEETHQNEDEIESTYQKEGENMQQQMIIAPQQPLIHKHANQQFDSADYFMELQKISFARRIRDKKDSSTSPTQSPSKVELEEQSDLTEKQFILYKRPLLHQDKKQYDFDSADFFRDLDLKKKENEKLEAEKKTNQPNHVATTTTNEESKSIVPQSTLNPSNFHQEIHEVDQDLYNQKSDVMQYLRSTRTKSLFAPVAISYQEDISPSEYLTNNKSPTEDS